MKEAAQRFPTSIHYGVSISVQRMRDLSLRIQWRACQLTRGCQCGRASARFDIACGFLSWPNCGFITSLPQPVIDIPGVYPYLGSQSPLDYVVRSLRRRD